MEQHDLQQGSPEWHAHRATHFNASDAPAMLGVSKYKTRSRLLDEMATGIAQEVDAATQSRFDEGHRFEALARPLAEKIIEKRLYPVVGSEGKYSASFDGLTMDETINFEHKRLNAELRRILLNGEPLPELYTSQLEQQHLVSGAEKTLFMASEWDSDDSLIEELHCWYVPDQAMRERLVAGWEQFEKDLADHVPQVIAERPQAEIQIELPALFIQAHGGITSSNMEEFGQALAKKLAEVRAIALVTDQDFSNAKQAAKTFREQCAKLKLAKEQMLSQTMTVGEAARMIDSWSEDLRVTALQLEKDVEREDQAKKVAMIGATGLEFSAYVESLEIEIKPLRLNIQRPDWAGAIKGKSKYASMQDALDTLLANAKAAADAIAKDIRQKQAWCRENADGHQFLFADMAQIITKADDDFKLLVTSRITAHKQAEAERLEQERARIQAEEEAKANAKVEAERVAAEQRVQEAQAQAARDAQAAIAAAQAEAAKPAVTAAAQEVATVGMAAMQVTVANDQVSVQHIPAAQVIDSGSTIKLGQISDRLGFALTADFLRSLGFEPVGRERAAVLYRECDFPLICDRLVSRINAVRNMKAAA